MPLDQLKGAVEQLSADIGQAPGRLHHVNGPQRFDLTVDIHRVGTGGGAGGAGVADIEPRAFWHFRQREPGMV